MSDTPMRPQFGGKLQNDTYYASVNRTIAVLRPHATLRTISMHLNATGLTTPSGASWNRSRLANYLNSSAAKSN
jgi:hypothetical protein